MDNVFDNPNQNKTLADKDNHVKGILNLSGFTYIVGIRYHESKNIIFIQGNNDPEPIYISITEAAALYNLLKSCVEE